MLILCYSFSGIFAISVALLCDGYIGNLQELAMKKYQIPGLQIVSARLNFELAEKGFSQNARGIGKRTFLVLPKAW